MPSYSSASCTAIFLLAVLAERTPVDPHDRRMAEYEYMPSQPAALATAAYVLFIHAMGGDGPDALALELPGFAGRTVMNASKRSLPGAVARNGY